VGCSGTGHEAAQTKDRFNELVGKALESTSSAPGHHRQTTEPSPHHKSSEVNDDSTTRSLQKKDEIIVEPTGPKALDSSNIDLRQSSPRRVNNEPTAVLSNTTDTTQSTAVDSTQITKAAVEKVPYRISRFGGQQQPSKEYISDPSAFVTVTTQSTPVTSTGDAKSLTGSSQQPEESELGRQSMWPRTESTKLHSEHFSEGRTDNISRLDILNATNVERSQHLDNSKLKSSPSSSLTPSPNIQPLIHSGEVSGGVESESLQAVQSMDSEAAKNKVPGFPNLSEPPVSILKQDTTVSIRANSYAEKKRPVQPNTADSTTKLAHPTDASGFEHRLETSATTTGTVGQLEKGMLSELATGVKKESLYDARKQKQLPENRTDKTHSTRDRSRQPNVVEETQIVHILTLGGSESKSSCSTLKAAEASAVDVSNKLAPARKADAVIPQPDKDDLQKTVLSNVYTDGNISKVAGEELSKLSSTLTSPSGRDMPVPESYISGTTKQPLTLNDPSTCSEIPHSVSSEPNTLQGDLVSVDSKPSIVALRKIRHAAERNVQPWPEQKVERMRQPELQVAVVQEVEMATEQVLFKDKEIEMERVEPVTVESAVNTTDCRQFLTKTGCYYHSNALTLGTSAGSSDCCEGPNSEKIGYMECLPQLERLKLQNVESTFHVIDVRRLLLKTRCQYRSNAQTLPATETGHVKNIGSMQGGAKFQQIKPQSVQSTFHSADVSPLLRRTGWHYRTNLLSFHPANKDVVVPADRLRKSDVDLPKETIGNIADLKSESVTTSVVKDHIIHGRRGTVKVHPLPKILTLTPQRRQQIKTYDQFSTPSSKQTMEQKLVPSASVGKVCRSDVEPLATLPVAVQPVEVNPSSSQDSGQPRSFDTLSSSSQECVPSAAYEKSCNNMSVGLTDLSSVRDGRVSDCVTDSPASVLEEASPGHGAYTCALLSGRSQSQDNTSVFQPRSSNPHNKQLAKYERSSDCVGSITQATTTTASSEFSAATPDEKTVSLSNNPVVPAAQAATSDQSVVEQHRAQFSPSDTDSGGNPGQIRVPYHNYHIVS